MKRFVLAAALLPLFSFAAYAADLPNTKGPPTFAPPPPPMLSWKGFHVGLNAGGAWSADPRASFSGSPNTAAFFAGNEFPSSLSTNPRGFIGGGQIGYDLQVAPSWVIGAEADFQGSTYRGSATAQPTPVFLLFPFTTSVSQRNDWFGTVRARAGFLVIPNLLVYGTGGLAYGEVLTSFSTIINGIACGPGFTCATGSTSSTRAGWTAGAGAQWMISPNWSVKAEYLFVDLGSQSVTAQSTAPGYFFTARDPFRENVVRVGFDYKFDMFAPPGPVMQKY
jgi:outer membrane immunogenic protein